MEPTANNPGCSTDDQRMAVYAMAGAIAGGAIAAGLWLCTHLSLEYLSYRIDERVAAATVVAAAVIGLILGSVCGAAAAVRENRRSGPSAAK